MLKLSLIDNFALQRLIESTRDWHPSRKRSERRRKAVQYQQHAQKTRTQLPLLPRNPARADPRRLHLRLHLHLRRLLGTKQGRHPRWLQLLWRKTDPREPISTPRKSKRRPPKKLLRRRCPIHRPFQSCRNLLTVPAPIALSSFWRDGYPFPRGSSCLTLSSSLT